ncbi:MAG: hypothetical protein BWY11_01478 [Firmicutes bacterium ADurb.Bin182]|nr:MAG: hypothetical protein BWY11_01478 [Firmicutes bacterium ADurb.Bin182]
MENAITKNTVELEQLETVIKQNIGAFYEVGRALMKIRDKGLYRDVLGYETFEAYCKARWDFNSSRARQFISASEVVDNVKSVTIGNAPTNERQVRPLMALEPDQQREAWQKAVATAPEGKVTAAHVSKIVKEMTEQEPTARSLKKMVAGPPAQAINFAMTAISHLERISDDDPTREEAFGMVENWIKEHR